MLSKQKSPAESPTDSSLTQETGSLLTSTEQKSICVPKADEEACPVCQEKLSTQKMVFQCGHVTCCKCKSFTLLTLHYSRFAFKTRARLKRSVQHEKAQFITSTCGCSRKQRNEVCLLKLLITFRRKPEVLLIGGCNMVIVLPSMHRKISSCRAI